MGSEVILFLRKYGEKTRKSRIKEDRFGGKSMTRDRHLPTGESRGRHLQDGEHYRRDDGEPEDDVAGLVQFGDLESLAQVPGQVAHTVQQVVGDRPGQTKLCTAVQFPNRNNRNSLTVL